VGLELLLGAAIMSLWAMTIPGVVADAITTMRAAAAGEWDTVNKQRDRKAAKSQSRRELASKAWAAARTARNKKAGGTGQYRPGVGAYLSDVYHGLCEDGLEKRHVKRANRPPIGPYGKRPIADRLDDAFQAKVEKQRQQTGYVGRVARKLIDPVGEKRQPTGAVESDPLDTFEELLVATLRARKAAGSAASGQAGSQSDGPRIACPVCGDTLTMAGGGWEHPEGSTCALGYPLDVQKDDTPTSVVHDDEHPYCVSPCGPKCTTQRHSYSRASSGKWAWSCRRPGCDGKGFDYDTETLARDAAARHRCANGTPPSDGVQVLGGVKAATTGNVSSVPGSQDNELTRAAMDALADADPDNMRRARNMDDAHESMYRKFPKVDPVAINEAIVAADRVPGCNTCGQRHGAKPPCVHRQAAANRLREARARAQAAMSAPKTSTTNDPNNTSNGGTTVNTATGDVHDVETCKNECEALADDLVRVDTALDVIDEAIRSAQAAVEHINAWLKSKNADACVPGMDAALDALSADRIKELIDTVAIAKQGVQHTIDNLVPLEEANELVGNTDGSALNGR
jgi:hypothetical protein